MPCQAFQVPTVIEASISKCKESNSDKENYSKMDIKKISTEQPKNKIKITHTNNNFFII